MSSNTIYIEFANELSRLFEKWLKAANVSDYESLKELRLLDQFKLRVPPDFKVCLEEKEVEQVKKAARLADNYPLMHKTNCPFRSGLNVKGITGSQSPTGTVDDRNRFHKPHRVPSNKFTNAYSILFPKPC